MFAVHAGSAQPGCPARRPRRRRLFGTGGPRGVAGRPTAAGLNSHDLWTLRGVGLKPEQSSSSATRSSPCWPFSPVGPSCCGSADTPAGTDILDS
jgi:hypothetical protein